MNINEKEIEQASRKIDLTGFSMNDELNPKIWDKEEKMKSDVKKTLLKIADDYFESLDLPGIDIEDVTMTGSLANYNWSKYSDVDLHIVVDYDDLPMDRELVQDFLKSKSSAWNKEHDVKIYGYDVELYVQDINDPHHSTGVYSILNNEWNIKPEKKKISFSDKSVIDKSNRLMDRIEDIYDDIENGDNEDIIKRVDKLTEKIKKMRQSGLESGGEFSVENIVFKVLRRNGMLDRLYDIKTVAYDKSVTLESEDLDRLIESLDSNDFDWIREVEPTYIPKVGDRVRCKPGFSSSTDNIVWFKSPNYGGSGYREGKEFIVGSVAKETSDLHEIYGEAYIAWPENDHLGVFNWALEPVTLNSINESDDMGWIRDSKPSLNMDNEWMLINDVDPNSYEESKLIQEFLFDLGYKWYSGKGVQEIKINDIQHFNSEGLKGDLTYCTPNEKSMTEDGMKNHENIYYWSEIKPNNLNESDDMDWIRDVSLPSEYDVDFKKGKHLIKVDGLSTDEKEKIQQIILNKGISWGDLDKNVKKGEHYTDEGVYYYAINNGWLLVGRGGSQDENDKFIDGGLFLDYNRHTIKESDDFDWVRDVEPANIEDLVIVVNNENELLKALNFFELKGYGYNNRLLPKKEIIRDFREDKKYNHVFIYPDINKHIDLTTNKWFKSFDNKKWNFISIEETTQISESKEGDFDWINDINPIPLEVDNFVELDNIVWDYFETNGELSYEGWSYGIYNNNREVMWTHPDFEDLVIMATPFSNENYSLPITFQMNFDSDGIDDVPTPIFKYKSELTDWLSNEYPKIVLETIEWGMGDYTDEIFLRDE